MGTTDGLYPGPKNQALLVQKVFKVAKALGPSVIYINEIEKVMNTDKKKAKVLKPPLKDKPERIKKQLLVSMKDLEKEHEEINTKLADPDKEVQDEAKAMNNQVV